MSRPMRLGLVGIGKIARDQHVPAISADHRFDLVATASRNARLTDVPAYRDIAAMITGGHQLDAVSICTPPGGRYDQACVAIDAGLHVMLEKPPAATISEITELATRAAAQGVTLFATWHSREAAAVEPARAWLSDKHIAAVRILWKEDIRRWHPGQEWILSAGGFGVFDPGINALSIATRILPHALLLDSAWMDVPAGRGSPLTAGLNLRCGTAVVKADFDFLQTGPQTWDIEVETDQGLLRLSMGGRVLHLPGMAEERGLEEEYPRLYRRFAALVDREAQDVDLTPLQIVADAFLLGERRTTARFEF